MVLGRYLIVGCLDPQGKTSLTLTAQRCFTGGMGLGVGGDNGALSLKIGVGLAAGGGEEAGFRKLLRLAGGVETT